MAIVIVLTREILLHIIEIYANLLLTPAQTTANTQPLADPELLGQIEKPRYSLGVVEGLSYFVENRGLGCIQNRWLQLADLASNMS